MAREPFAVPLVDALRAAYPERCGVVSQFPYKGPTQYAVALLRASIAQSVVLAHDDDSVLAEAIYRDVTDLYQLRSDIIHGNPKMRRDLPTLWGERGYTHVLTTDRTHTLLDRWRDIVRRALTARLMLRDDRLGPPIWPFVGMKGDVDLKLAVKSERDAWRARVVAGATTYGLPLLVEPAPPLVDYRHG